MFIVFVRHFYATLLFLLRLPAVFQVTCVSWIPSVLILHLLLRPQKGCEILWSACVYVCLSVGLSVCSHVSITHVQISRRFLWPWLGLILRRQWNGLYTSGFVDGVVFSHNGANWPELKTTLCFVEFARWRHRERSYCLQLKACSGRKHLGIRHCTWHGLFTGRMSLLSLNQQWRSNEINWKHGTQPGKLSDGLILSRSIAGSRSHLRCPYKCHKRRDGGRGSSYAATPMIFGSAPLFKAGAWHLTFALIIALPAM